MPIWPGDSEELHDYIRKAYKEFGKKVVYEHVYGINFNEGVKAHFEACTGSGRKHYSGSHNRMHEGSEFVRRAGQPEKIPELVLQPDGTYAPEVKEPEVNEPAKSPLYVDEGPLSSLVGKEFRMKVRKKKFWYINDSTN